VKVEAANLQTVYTREPCIFLRLKVVLEGGVGQRKAWSVVVVVFVFNLRLEHKATPTRKISAHLISLATIFSSAALNLWVKHCAECSFRWAILLTSNRRGLRTLLENCFQCAQLLAAFFPARAQRRAVVDQWLTDE